MKQTAVFSEEAPGVSDKGSSGRGDGLPVWIRAPMRGAEHYSGLTRGKLYVLDKQGLIRSVSLREPGTLRGCRLFHLASILSYIERCAEQYVRKEGKK